MDNELLLDLMTKLIADSPDNRITMELTTEPSLDGVAIFDSPIMGVASADDAFFSAFKSPSVIGPHHMRPCEWLGEARSVVSFFFPFSDGIRASNRCSMEMPSAGWLIGRIEGQALINRLMAEMAAELVRRGHLCCVPSLNSKFWSKTNADKPHHQGLSYTSNWSERHVAFACGIGTFGLSKGLITSKGMAGRIGNLVTDMDLKFSDRPYSGPMDYCAMCGDCARNCPVGAITIDGGKDHDKCSDFLDKVLGIYAPRYGCGKCQVGVPCEFGLPER